MRRSERTVKAGFFRTETIVDEHHEVVEEYRGWQLHVHGTLEQHHKLYEWRGTKQVEVRGGVGYIITEVVRVVLAPDGALVHITDRVEGAPGVLGTVPHRYTVRPLAAREVSIADFKWHLRFKGGYLAPAFSRDEMGVPVHQRFDKPGLGLSLALRRLADTHGLLPKRQRP